MSCNGIQFRNILKQRRTYIMKKHWTKEEFKNPPAWFRGAPFWAWNTRLNPEQLKKQVSYFKEMGLGGYHIHCRVGLDTEYLGEEFLECVSEVAKEGKKQGLYTYLYDEDRWPSGAAGGLVTKEEAYRSRHLYFVPDENNEKEIKGKLLAVYRIHLKDGYLAEYTRVENQEIGEGIWKLYLQIAEPSPWFNNQTYLDTLNKKAVEQFIHVTHETYDRLLGDEFGKSIPSIFTDEPQFQRKETLDFAEEKRGLILPFTDHFVEFYQKRYGEDLLEHFPEVVWELPDGQISKTRYQYHDGIAELFASSFADTIGKWCEEHNIMLTGHMMEEPTLHSQTCALGEAMRSYRSFQEPGIDILCDRREYTTAKQAQSAVHQFGCSGMLSELYGVTNWDYDFRSHKLQGDWQAALGVTRRVPHLSWVSMEGEAKRDYPASIFYQSPWYKEYKLVEDHFARVNTAMMRGKPHVKVGVIHPVESYWLHFGPKEQTAQIREVLEQKFRDITEWLLFGNIDFDFLAESLLPIQDVHIENGRLCVGQMQYDAILVPGCETLRNTTVEYLSNFAKEKGVIIFAGQEPEYVDAVPSPTGKELAAKCIRIPFDKIAVLNSLEFCREVEIRRPDGMRAEQFLYQIREDEENRWMFLANGKVPKTQDLSNGLQYQIRIKGNWKVEICDTQNVEISHKPAVVRNGWTVFEQIMYIHDSLLLRLTPGENENLVQETDTMKKAESLIRDGKNIPQPEGFSLEEPNAMLLDQCEYRFDQGEWQPVEEILRIDNTLREKLGYPKRMDAWPQPWVQKEEANSEHTIELCFRIHSEITCENVYLALEGLDQSDIIWNGVQVKKEVCGWYVDECYKKTKLGAVKQGENILLIRRPFGRKTNLEWCYLLGDFGVRVAGRTTQLIPIPEKLVFGDYAVQGFPFYTGNIKYQVPLQVEGGNYRIKISKFRAPLLKVSVDGGEWKPIAYAPYEADLGYLSPGTHHLEIMSFGSRGNAFGPVHFCDETSLWHGPNDWRTENERFAYEYQLKRTGILKTPIIYKI